MPVDALISRLPAADWPALAPFIHQHNQRPQGVRCLHCEQGADAPAHAVELAGLPPDEAAFWHLHGGGRTLAFIGCEFDPALGRAWLRGPLAVDDAVLADAAPRLLQALRAALPGLHTFDAFPNETDAALNRFYAGQGFQRLAAHRLMQAPCQSAGAAADQAPRLDAPTVAAAEPADLASLLPLHHRLFPNSYLKDEDLQQALGDPTRCVLVCRDGDATTLGYLHAKAERQLDELYIDYVGVHETARGRGIGRQLLQAARHWGGQEGLPRAALTVREDRAPALSLYEGLGFHTVHVGVQWRLHTGLPR